METVVGDKGLYPSLDVSCLSKNLRICAAQLGENLIENLKWFCLELLGNLLAMWVTAPQMSPNKPQNVQGYNGGLTCAVREHFLHISDYTCSILVDAG